jgi:hypothetical protein
LLKRCAPPNEVAKVEGKRGEGGQCEALGRIA